MVQRLASKVAIKLETHEVAIGGLPKDLDDSKKSVSVYLRFAAIVNRTGGLQFLPAFHGGFHMNWIFMENPCKPSILGYPVWKPPYLFE